MEWLLVLDLVPLVLFELLIRRPLRWLLHTLQKRGR